MKALFFGLGGVGQRHLRNLLSLRPDCRVAAIRHAGKSFEIGNDLVADQSVDIVTKYGVTVLRNMDEGLAFAPDLAVVSNPSARHADTCLPLLSAGIPVFLEKPAATEPADFEALTQAATRTPLAVGYQMRWHPCVRRLKEILGDGSLGRLHSVEIAIHAHMPSWHAYEQPTDFYAGVRALGGGVVMTEIHEIDLLSWFFGRPEKVFSVGGRLGRFDIDVEDTVVAALAYRTSTGPLPVALTMSFIQNPPSRRFVVSGEQGVAVLELPKLRLTVFDSDGSQRECMDISGFDRNRMFVDELSDFLDCLQSGQVPATSLDSIRDGQLTAFAIRAALETGQPTAP